MRFRRPSQDPLEINLTPLIDCLLFLLIFFMLSTSFSKASKIKLTLPEAKGETQAPVQVQTVEVSVSRVGDYAVNGETLANRASVTLRSAIEKVAAGKRDLNFVISADGNTPHQSVVTVMDVAGQMGFANLSISTRLPEEN